MKKKKGNIVAFFIIVLALAALIGFTATGTVKNIKLGLDLQGGFEVLYKVEPAKKGQEITDDVLQSTVAALQQRINAIGVAEPKISIESGDRVRVQLAGVDNPSKARKLLSTEARLSFRTADGEKVLDGSDLVPGEAKVSFVKGSPVVVLKVKNGDHFAKVTKRLLKKRMAIWLDYEKGDSLEEALGKPDEKTHLISAPVVQQVLRNEAIITGMDSLEEAKELAKLLNAGALPVDLKEIYSNSVGAQFGQNALQETLVAGAIGIALIFLFMMMYYRFPGIIAVITLCAYMYLVLIVYDWMNAVLTLSGIAAFVLGVGMAVDANVITYERLKEEIRSGKSILSAFKTGTRRSFVTILDANLTTILAAAVLYAFGTSSVKGFAVMLIVSILASFITAVYGTRVLLGFWVKSRYLDRKPGYFGVKEKDINEL
ncbi:MAG TPA: protein translocase subunit SecD [Bacillales bacterium]|nr:protein translocase subunit SecD [Bacillales bacterium]